MIKIVHDVATNTITEHEMTEEEIAKIEFIANDPENITKEGAEREKALIESKKALLEKLGITTEEAALLGL